MSAHTPGPWVLFSDSCNVAILPAMRSGEVCRFVPGSISAADARLIAAAPELLALVEEFAAGPDLQACDARGERQDARNQWLLSMREKAQAAIAKATGGGT